MAARTLFLIVMVVLSGLIIGAVLFRVRPRNQTRVPDYDALVRFDPTREGGHLLPGLDLLVKGEFAGHPVRWRTNSKGFRSQREFGYEPASGVRRILLLGDSFVDGMRTDQARTIGYLLEKWLSAETSATEVLISGHNNPVNAWYYFQEHGSRYHPDVVILGVTLGNDLTWNSYRSTFVPAPATDGPIRLRIEEPLVQANAQYAQLLLPDEAYLPPDGLDAWRDREIAFRELLASRSRLFAQSVPPLIAPGPNSRRRVRAADFFNALGLFYQPLAAAATAVFVDFEEVLLGFHRAVSSRGGQFLVVLFPVRAQVSPADWNLLTRAYSLNPAKFDLSFPNQRLVHFCHQSRIHCLDLLPALRQKHGDQGPFYRSRGDMHFNEVGQAFAAGEIAKSLRDAGLVR